MPDSSVGSSSSAPSQPRGLATQEIPTPVQNNVCGKDGCTIVLKGGFPHSGLCCVPEMPSRGSGRSRQPSSQPPGEQTLHLHSRAKTINALAEGAGFGAYNTLAEREAQSPMMLAAAIKRWKSNAKRIQMYMRPYFTVEAWMEVEILVTNRYFVDYVQQFPILHGSQYACSHPSCPNGTLVQGLPVCGSTRAPFVLRHTESHPERIVAFELDHMVEVQTTCQKWANARASRDLSAAWNSNLSVNDATQILEDLFSPDGLRWRCGSRMVSLGGEDCHLRAFSFSADRRRQKQAMTCQRCQRMLESQPQLAAHFAKCACVCMTCGDRFGNSLGCRQHERGCSARRAAAERAKQAEGESPVM